MGRGDSKAAGGASAVRRGQSAEQQVFIEQNGKQIHVADLVWAAEVVAAANTDGDRVDELISDVFSGKRPREDRPADYSDQADSPWRYVKETNSVVGQRGQQIPLDFLLGALDNVYTAGSLDAAAEQCSRALAGKDPFGDSEEE